MVLEGVSIPSDAYTLGSAIRLILGLENMWFIEMIAELNMIIVMSL